MKRFLATVMLALALGGCAGGLQRFGDAFTTISEARVPQREILIAAKGVDATLVSATIYLRQKRCDGSTPICRSPDATRALVPAVRSLRVAQANAYKFLKDHPDGSFGPRGIIDALNGAANSVNQIQFLYNIK